MTVGGLQGVIVLTSRKPILRIRVVLSIEVRYVARTCRVSNQKFSAADRVVETVFFLHGATILRQLSEIDDIAVRDEFRDVAEHVVKPNRIRLERSDRRSRGMTVLAIGHIGYIQIRIYLLEGEIGHILVGTAVLRPLPPISRGFRAATRRISPLRWADDSDVG